jgi:hypothetical protein
MHFSLDFFMFKILSKPPKNCHVFHKRKIKEIIKRGLKTQRLLKVPIMGIKGK